VVALLLFIGAAAANLNGERRFIVLGVGRASCRASDGDAARARKWGKLAVSLYVENKDNDGASFRVWSGEKVLFCGFILLMRPRQAGAMRNARVYRGLVGERF
jgi:hypothetical protein